MQKSLYGKKLPEPTEATLRAFGSEEPAVLLPGGLERSYISGKIVLKPAENEEYSNWMAELLLNLPDSPDVRFTRPIRANDGGWIHDGYGAWEFLPGEHVPLRYGEKLSASVAFHKLLKDIPKTEFVDNPNNSWTVADWVAWGRLEFNYDQEFMDLYNQIKPHLKPLDLPSQLIHGDIGGNFLIDPTLPPAVIDFSPSWAPNGFAEGIMLADAITWYDTPDTELEPFKQIANIDQFAWRGILRRITEQPEHIKRLGKDKTEALELARSFQKAIDYLKRNF